MKVEGVDWRWVLLYLTLTMSKLEQVDAKVQGLLPRRNSRRGRPPTILTAHLEEGESNRFWFPISPEALSEDQKKLLLGCVIEQLVKVTFKTHFYEWEGCLYRQKQGGPIGLRATGPVSRVLMDQWVREMKIMAERTMDLKEINPVMYEGIEFHLLRKYVDDCVTATNTLRRGTKWCPHQKAFLWTQEQADKDILTPEDQVTMREIANMASGVLECLQFTFDSPSLNKPMAMLVLDTRMWLGWEERETGVPASALEDPSLITAKPGALRRIILYCFYRKPMANPVANLASSAQPQSMKL